MRLTYINLFAVSFCSFFATAVFAVTDIPDVVIDNYSDNNKDNLKPLPTLSSKTPIETISSKEIQESNAQTLDQLLQGRFGIQTNDLYGDGNNTKISIRGFGDNSSYNSLIMIDGQPLTNPDLALPAINFIPLDEIEQIDIMPSSGGVLYGDQAVGGVINITTKKAAAKVKNIYADYGTFNTRKIGGQLSDQFSNGFGYGINALHYDTDNYRDHNNYQSNNINAILSYNSNTLDSYLRYWKINNHTLLPNGLTAEQVAEDRRQAGSVLAFNNQDTDFWQFALKKNINDKSIFNLKSYAEKMSGIGAYSYDIMGSTPTNFDEKRSAYNFNPEISSCFDFFKHSFFPTFGIAINSGEYSYNSDTYTSNSKLLEKSGYAQINTYITTKLSTVFGIRAAEADYNLNNSTYVGDANPVNRANATDIETSYALTNDTKLFAKRADNYRFPKTDEQSFTVTGAPLNTQTGTSYETGFNLQKKNLTLLVELYELDLKNEIMVVPADNGTPYNENIDPTQRRGIIVNGGIPINSKLKLQGDLGYVDAKFSEGQFSGNRIPFVAENTAKLAAIYAIKKYFTIYLESIYVGSRYPVNDVENKDNLLGGFTTYNLSFNYQKAPWIISLKINNLTNKQYYSYVTTSYGSNNSVSTMYYPAAGINALFSVGVSL